MNSIPSSNLLLKLDSKDYQNWLDSPQMEEEASELVLEGKHGKLSSEKVGRLIQAVNNLPSLKKITLVGVRLDKAAYERLKTTNKEIDATKTLKPRLHKAAETTFQVSASILILIGIVYMLAAPVAANYGFFKLTGLSWKYLIAFPIPLGIAVVTWSPVYLLMYLDGYFSIPAYSKIDSKLDSFEKSLSTGRFKWLRNHEFYHIPQGQTPLSQDS